MNLPEIEFNISALQALEYLDRFFKDLIAILRKPFFYQTSSVAPSVAIFRTKNHHWVVCCKDSLSNMQYNYSPHTPCYIAKR